ncbi:GNAT family N-acetyltransferase [Exiguobacterium sp. s141]|uniref:GNAT family N-acetyltransferase n=1 Tax=Exiguobacterium sp. s141 TaxID=2751240 RepID=UPI001BE6DBE5|nr:GNAT family N-acetyltransferase [Exiguobacterium sp. s141]
MNLTFQRATESQLTEIYSLAGVNREEATNHVSADSREKMIGAYEHSAKFGAYFLCLVDGETLVGWTQIDKAFDFLTGAEVGWVNDLYIKPSFRGHGYAKLLMREALDTFKQMGHTDVRLNVYAHNQTAMRLYEQLGFTDVSKFMKIDI